MAVLEGVPYTDDRLIGSGENDVIRGFRGDDDLRGGGGDDYIHGGRGNDDITGGRGSDVMWGGLDADRFIFRANATRDGDVDWICDFSLSQGDTLVFTGDFTFVSAVRVKLTETEFNDYDLRNNVGLGTDIVITVQDAQGDTATINLLDVWSSASNSAWVAYLSDNFGLDLA